MTEQDEQNCRSAENIEVDRSTASAEIIVGVIDRQCPRRINSLMDRVPKMWSVQCRETTLRLPHIDPSTPRESPSHDFEAHFYLPDVRVPPFFPSVCSYLTREMSGCQMRLETTEVFYQRCSPWIGSRGFPYDTAFTRFVYRSSVNGFSPTIYLFKRRTKRTNLTACSR